jgi:hypothetical protein
MEQERYYGREYIKINPEYMTYGGDSQGVD